MSKTTPEFLALMERSARFEYHQGGSTLVAPLHSTGWRVMPALLVSFLGFHGKYELVDRAPITLRPGDTLCAVPGLRHCVSAVGRKSGISHWSHTQCEIFQGVSLFFLLEPLLVIRGERSERLADINRQLGEIAAAELSVPRAPTPSGPRLEPYHHSPRRRHLPPRARRTHPPRLAPHPRPRLR